jgi:hypothetical protein
MSFRRVTDTSGVIRMTIVGDATPWSIILATLEVSFMIELFLEYRPLVNFTY